jgi:hypothetical protein
MGREAKGPLRARFDAELAGVTLVGADDIGLPIAVRPGLEPSDQRERVAVLAGEAPDLEDVVRADADAVFLSLASVAVDDRRNPSRLAFALARRRGLPCAVAPSAAH